MRERLTVGEFRERFEKGKWWLARFQAGLSPLGASAIVRSSIIKSPGESSRAGRPAVLKAINRPQDGACAKL